LIFKYIYYFLTKQIFWLFTICK